MKKLNPAVIKSIMHWLRMIWFVLWYRGSFEIVEEYNIQCGWDYSGVYIVMRRQIKENPGSDYCALCQRYMDEYLDCEKCPLYKKGHYCGDDNSLWQKVVHSKTKKTWIINALRMVAILWSVRWEE